MKILVLDNYDSFTYNLVHILRTLGLHKDLDIFRNDKISIKEVGQYDCILLSPGPGIPRGAGIMLGGRSAVRCDHLVGEKRGVVLLVEHSELVRARQQAHAAARRVGAIESEVCVEKRVAVEVPKSVSVGQF